MKYEYKPPVQPPINPPYKKAIAVRNQEVASTSQSVKTQAPLFHDEKEIEDDEECVSLRDDLSRLTIESTSTDFSFQL